MVKAKAPKPKLTVDKAVKAVRLATKGRVIASKRLHQAELKIDQAEMEFRAANTRLWRARKALNEAMR